LSTGTLHNPIQQNYLILFYLENSNTDLYIFNKIASPFN